MTWVQMIWPATGAVANIPEQAVDGHRGLGWVPLSERTEPAEPTVTAATADTSAEAEPTTKPSRRRGADTQE